LQTIGEPTFRKTETSIGQGGDIMKTLVTGSTGCVGSAFVERLLARGYEVRALARKTSDLSHLKATGAEIVFGDVTDFDSLPPVVKGIDIVFHCAAKVTPGWGTWPEYEANTVKGTDNMLRASAEAGVKRFLQVSSVTVYGDACQKGDTPVDENTPCEARKTSSTFYDYSKMLAEQVCWAFHKQGKIQVSMIRIGSAYGPRDRLLADRNYINTMLPLVMWPGKCNPRYAIVHTHDIAELAIMAATRDKGVGQVYNVAGPDVVTLKDFARVMAKARGGPKIMVTMPYTAVYFFAALNEEFARLRRAKQMPFLNRYSIRQLKREGYLDGTKAKNELGWVPRTSLEEGTKQYVQWRKQKNKRK
jgi:nucleoside-diphosphate-sugar epimerase